MDDKMKKNIHGYTLILSYIGIFSFLIGIINLMPLLLILFQPDQAPYALHFMIPGFLSIFIGTVIIISFKGKEKGRLERNQDALLVVLIWLYAILISAIPFYLTGHYNITQSIFETTSGYSTTGFTIVDVDQAPNIFLLYRSLLQFFGGVGLVLILTSAISDKLGMRLYSAEGHSDKLMPNLIRSARMIMSIYVGYIILGVLFYVMFGMSLFDAINHSISAVATGGFSTRSQSIGYYDHLGIEIVTMVLMILGGTNFFVHLQLISRRLKHVTKHIELKFLGILALIFIPMFTISLMQSQQDTFFHSLRVTTFHFVSAITTTGLQTVSTVNIFPVSILFGTLFLMMIGASIGSTAGGMKLYRVALAFKSVYWHLKDQLSHKKVIRTHTINRYGMKIIIDKDAINQNYTFIAIYLFVLMFGISVFTFYGYSFRDSIFEFTSVLGTIGLSVGLISYHSPALVLWMGIVGMLIARLESIVIIYAIVVIVRDITKGKQNRHESKGTY